MSRRRGISRACHVSVAAAAFLVAGPGLADPQGSVGLTAGGVIEDVTGPGGTGGAFHLGARGDLLFLRSSPHQMALGPYLDVATAGFRDVDAGGGVSWLVPVWEDLPLVLSGGAFARNGRDRAWAPGVEGTVFAGSRSYNFHSSYGMAIGFFAQTRWVPESPSTLDVVLGVRVDAEILALPVLFVVNAFRR